MDFVSSDCNTESIKGILKTSGVLRCAVAFWGEEAVNLLPENLSKFEIICNLESGATNPYLIENLLSRKVKIRTNRNLHAKVYLAEQSKAVVGSANISSNGLSYEGDEVSGWIEAGIVIDDKKTLKDISKWFSKLWKDSDKINNVLMNEAKIKWKKKRKNREYTKVIGKSLLTNLSKYPREFKDRNIYITVCRSENNSEDAENKFSEVKSQLNITEKIDYWEDWSELPEDSYIISLFYSLDEKFEFGDFHYIAKNKQPEFV